MASGPLLRWQRPFSRRRTFFGNDQFIEGDPVMEKKSKPVKGKKTAPVKPLMKRADLPAVKPLIKF
jgi:hypothetical protein